MVVVFNRRSGGARGKKQPVDNGGMFIIHTHIIYYGRTGRFLLLYSVFYCVVCIIIYICAHFFLNINRRAHVYRKEETSSTTTEKISAVVGCREMYKTHTGMQLQSMCVCGAIG